MAIPEEIIQKLNMFCQENDLGLAFIGSNSANIHLIMIGERDRHPNEIAIMCANMLLEGVLSGKFQEDNEAAKEDLENAKPN